MHAVRASTSELQSPPKGIQITFQFGLILTTIGKSIIKPVTMPYMHMSWCDLLQSCVRRLHQKNGCAGGLTPRKAEKISVVPLSRANNVSIMLTQFSQFKKGPQEIRRAVVTGKGLSLERLSLLLQVISTLHTCSPKLFMLSFAYCL